MTTVGDTELVERARRRDTQAFGELVERHQRLVVGVALARCGDLALAEDVAQEAFVTAWRDLDRLREATRVAPWIAGIARNLAASASRRQMRRDAAALPDAAPVPTPSDVAIDREDRELLANALRDVPDAQREALVLFYLEGESIAGIAAALGTSEDVVKQRLSRGRQALREGVATRVESALARVRGRPSRRAGVIAALSVAGTRKAVASSTAGKVFGMISVSKALVGATAVVVASGALWLGTRSSHDQARASPAVTPPGVRSSVPGSLHVRRVDPVARAQLLAQIREAEQRADASAGTPGAQAPESAPSHTATSPPSLPAAPELAKDYIHDAIRDLTPVLRECYEHALENNPTLAGNLTVAFTIEGEPGVGGVVADSSIVDAESDISDASMRECVAQTTYALEIDPPAGGGTIGVQYTMQFAPTEPK
jgi:RNA polymerase sigma factor (sigma-70 family)